jgi:VWFA-related protein
MRHRLPVLLLILLSLVLPAAAQDEPIDSGQTEEVQVNLVIVEALALDKQGRTVPDLTKDDFLLSVQGQEQQIDTFDVVCPIGATDDPVPVKAKERREPIAPELDRLIVFVFDYYHLSQINRTAALRNAAVMMAREKTPEEGMMIAALANRLRVEQRFTRSLEWLVYTIERMEHDLTLYARQFETITPRSFFDNLGTLMDVLAEYPGPKAVVLFSDMMNVSSDMDLWYGELAQRAAAARVAIYPVSAEGLQPGGPAGGSPALARLANDSGGRYARFSNDLSVPYAWAQRDMSCRYALGYYADTDVSRKQRLLGVKTRRSGVVIRTPAQIRYWSDEEQQASRIRAAFANPGKTESPLLRVQVFPFRPSGKSAWESLLTVSFPLHLDANGATRQIGASLDRGVVTVDSAQETFRFDPPRDGKAGVRPVTLYDIEKVKTGQHSLTIVVNDPATGQIHSNKLDFAIPEIPKSQIVVRGPMLARVAEDGVRIKVGKEKGEGDTPLDRLIGPEASFEPLIVHQVKPDDALLAAWEICAIDVSPPAGATVERRLRRDGEIVHRLDPLPLALEGKKKLLCQRGLDKLDGGTLEEGSYRFEVAVVKKDPEKPVGLGLAPFAVSIPPATANTPIAAN